MSLKKPFIIIAAVLVVLVCAFTVSLLLNRGGSEPILSDDIMEKHINYEAASPEEFLNSLSQSNDTIWIVSQAPENWIGFSDIEGLMKHITSRKECPQVWSPHWQVVSYYPPEGKSTVGNEAMYLIQGFINNRYPVHIFSKTQNQLYDVNAYKEWFKWYRHNIKDKSVNLDNENLVLQMFRLYLENGSEVLIGQYLESRLFKYLHGASWSLMYELDRENTLLLMDFIYNKAVNNDHEGLSAFTSAFGSLPDAMLPQCTSYIRLLLSQNPEVILGEVSRQNDASVQAIISLLKKEAGRDPGFKAMLEELPGTTHSRNAADLINKILLEDSTRGESLKYFYSILGEEIAFDVEDPEGRYYYTGMLQRTSLDGTYSVDYLVSDYERIQGYLRSFSLITEKAAKYLSQAEKSEIGNLDGETQTLGLGNIPRRLKGGIYDLYYIIKKLDFELALKLYEDGEISREDLEMKSSDYIKAKDEYEVMIAGTYFSD
jgi:hypothetical protein